MTSTAKDNWKTAAIVSMGLVVTLVSFVFGTFFQGYVDKSQYHLIQQSIRRRYDSTDARLDGMTKRFDEAASARNEILQRVSRIEGRLSKNGK